MNIAQRIMDCADAGHILLSKRAAEDLAQYGHWKSCLHDLGEIEVKHGAVISVFNLYGEGFGNSQVPTGIKKQSRRLFPSRRQTPTNHRRSAVRVVAFLALLIAIGISAWAYFRNSSRAVGGAEFIPYKSIAVLPFDNFSDDKRNAYFADGIQDDILTALSKVSDLKVISRNSGMQYRDKARNMREIGQALGVAHLLEGSVRRENDKVRITAQLIDARSDAHLWAEHYDRDLADVFAIQSEVAENIVAQLRASISPSEKAAIDPAAAAKILAASKLEELVGGTGSLLPRSWFEALIARARGDAEKTREAFGAARVKIEAKLHDQPDDGVLLATLGLIDAGLSRKEQALAEGYRAAELRPISNDAVDGAAVIGNLAMTYGGLAMLIPQWTGWRFLPRRPAAQTTGN
jgi:TolB-like protein